MHRSRKLILTVALAAMLALAGGAALATGAIPGSDGVIHGCYDAKKGTLRVLDPASDQCDPKKETPIQWNQTGPQGAQGIQGPQGEQGPKGDTGDTGPKGDTGADGANGLNGTDGKTVLHGAGAPGAALGTDGDFYIDTAANAIYGPKDGGAWGGPTSLVGPQGEPGAKGDKGDQGDTGAAGAPGLSEYQTIPVQQAISAGGGYVFDAACPAGKTAISGGYALPLGSTVIESHPRDGDPGVWRLTFTVPSATTITLYLQCARTS